MTGIETEPEHHGSTGLLAVVIALGVTGLVMPVLVFVSMVTRLAAARREQRFAALRLVGATPGQISVVAAVEAGTAAVAGTMAGLAGFLLLRPLVARFPLDGSSFFPADLALTVPLAGLVLAGVPILAVITAMVSLRRIRISPLGVTRRTNMARPGRWRLAPLPLWMIMLGPALLLSLHSNDTWAVAAVIPPFAVIIMGIVIAGPWLTLTVGRGLGRIGAGPARLLAGRRLQADPSAAFRAVSGMVLAVFTATVINGVVPAMGASVQGTRQLPADLVAMTLTGGDGSAAASPGQAAAIVAAVGRQPGVRMSVVLRVPSHPAPDRWRGKANTALEAVLARCGDLLTLRMATCPDPDAVVATDASYLGEGLFAGAARVPAPPVTAQALAGLPAVVVVTATDGRAETIERVRTAMETAYPDTSTMPATMAESRADANPNIANLERLSNGGLLLTLLIAACGLATAVTGGLIERRRPLTLLRLTGVRTGCLARMMLAETALPLLVVASVSVAMGIGVSALLLNLATGLQPWRPPGAVYWLSLGGGLALAVAVTASPIPLLNRLTSPDSARYE